MATAAMLAFQWDPALRHAPGSPDAVSGGFQCACRCGYPGKRVTSSPSHAYQATRVHAENENRREGTGGEAVPAADYSASGEPPRQVRRTVAPPRPSVGSPAASRATAGTPCGCGCGEPSGGLFRPGHDSKLLSRLTGEIRSGAKTLEDAHREMDDIGTSAKLKDKLAGKVAN